ncbi:MAG: sulfatase-like hydrolase/transferase [bacterium]|nr:sulfatase-like hydrolase/transferase [bacterium]
MKRIAIGFGIGVMLVHCAGDSPREEGGKREPPAAATPVAGAAAGEPVVLISIDTLRSDRLPVYGYSEVATPAIDALRRDGILYERAYCHAPLTLPSHVSLMTGLLPDVHGIRDNQGYPFASAGLPFLPRTLQGLGYATGGAVSAYVLGRESGLGVESFDFYDDGVAFRENTALGGMSRRGAETLRAAEPWLRSVDGPFFFFFHLYEPHLPHDPPEPFASRYAAAYDGEIAAADEAVGELVALLRELGVYERAIIVLLSDHGEGLGDHGEEEHGILLYREALQVPLIVKLPAGRRAGDTVADPVQLVDVYPTLLALLGAPVPEDLPGRSLLQGAAGEEAPRPIYAETFYARLHYGWSDLASLIAGRFHYLDGPDPELYDLEADPSETRNLLREQSQVAATLRRQLSAYRRALEPPSPVAAETRARLEALGYLGGTAQGVDGPLPDPKAQLPTLADLRLAFEHVKKQDHARAVPAFRKVLAANPGMLDAWEHLGEALRHLGRWEEALDAYRKALEISGGDPELILTVALLDLELGRLDQARAGIAHAEEQGAAVDAAQRRLGLALARAGRFEQALAILRPLAAGEDPAAMNALALIYSEGGRQDAAAAILRRVLEIDPANAEAHEHLGLVHLRESRWAAAAAASRRALELDERRADAWNNLGVALYYQGRRAAALDAWERAVELDPRQLDTLYNLGTRAAEMGRREQARRALARFIEIAPSERYRDDLRRARVLLRRLGG